MTRRLDETQSFAYDPAGQLKWVYSTLSSANAIYNYGANGNRTSASEPGGGNDFYTPAPNNRVSEDSTYSYQYDLEGNLARRESKADATDYETYAWDQRHRLTKVNRYVDAALAESVAYRYNAADELIYRSVTPAGQTPQVEHYVVENGRRTMTVDGDGDVKRRVQYGPTGEVLFDQVFDATNDPVSQSEQDLLLPLGDHQHSTRVVLAHTTDASANLNDVAYVRQSIDYAQFGRITATLDMTGQPDAAGPLTSFMHHGSVYDAATGLQFKGEGLGGRWYSPDLGRFIGEDPIQDGANWYVFAGNDPINQSDPTGLYQQGHPLSGGFSGNETTKPTIKSGNLAASNLGGGPALSPSLNNFIKGAVNQAISAPSVAPLSIHDFNLTKDLSYLSQVYRPTALPPEAPSLHQIMNGYFDAYANNPRFHDAVDGYYANQFAQHQVDRGTTLEAFGARFMMSVDSTAEGMTPGAGELGDAQMLVSRDSTGGQRALAAGSLLLSLVTLGESPNASTARRAVGSVDTHTLKDVLAANRRTQQVDVVANGQYFDQIDVFAEFNATQKKVHGNTAGNQPATLYERYDANGNFLKHGVSQKPSTRYTQKELNGGYLIETQTGPRKEMLKTERHNVETNPGPLNKEPWAGKRKGN